MTFEEAMKQAAENNGYDSMLFEDTDFWKEAAELYAKSEYNKALEDLHAKLQSISGVQCDVCPGDNWNECGCRIEGQNEGVKAAIEELEKLKK